MRIFTLALSTIALVAPERLTAQAADTVKKDNVITVVGVGTVKVKPERAKISFAVRAGDNAFATAWKDNQIQTDKMQAALDRLKIAGMNIKVGPPFVTQNDWANAGMGQPMMPGFLPFNVTRSFQVVVANRDFAELNKQVLKVMETALTHGANSPAILPAAHVNAVADTLGNSSVVQVDFYSGNDGQYRQQAYQKAVEVALNNARGAALGGNVKLGQIVKIREFQEPNRNANVGLGLTVPTVESMQQDVNGEIELTVRVRVSIKF